MIATAYVAAESYVKHAMAMQAGRLSDAQHEFEYRQIQELSQRVENLGRALDDERKAALERRRGGGLKTGALQRHAAREVRLRVWTRYQEELLAENKKSLAERKKRQEARRIVAHETGLLRTTCASWSRPEIRQSAEQDLWQRAKRSDGHGRLTSEYYLAPL